MAMEFALNYADNNKAAMAMEFAVNHAENNKAATAESGAGPVRMASQRLAPRPNPPDFSPATERGAMGIKHGLPIQQGSLKIILLLAAAKCPIHKQDILTNQGILNNHRIRLPLKKPYWPTGSDSKHGISMNRECLTNRRVHLLLIKDSLTLTKHRVRLTKHRIRLLLKKGSNNRQDTW